jgi:hypothetical protein
MQLKYILNFTDAGHAVAAQGESTFKNAGGAAAPMGLKSEC